jgi:hypothetical protein
MNARELLHYELWSKRTTQKILVAFGVTFTALFLGFWGWQEVSRHWLTKGERTAAQIALQQVDEWRNVDAKSHEFIPAGERTRKALGDAETAARTERDRRTVFQLNICETTILEDRIRAELAETSSEKMTPEQRDAREKYLSDISKSGDVIRNLAGNACETLRKMLY